MYGIFGQLSVVTKGILWLVSHPKELMHWKMLGHHNFPVTSRHIFITSKRGTTIEFLGFLFNSGEGYGLAWGAAIFEDG